MSDQRPPAGNQKSEEAAPRRGQFWPILLLVLVLFLLLNSLWPSFTADRISFSFFMDQLEQQNIQTLDVSGTTAKGSFKVAPEKPIEYNAAGEPIARKADEEVPRYKKQFTVTLPSDSHEWLRGQIEEQRRAARAAEGTAGSPIEATFRDGDTFNYLFLGLMLLVPIALLVSLWVMFRRTQNQMMGGGGFSGFPDPRPSGTRPVSSERPLTTLPPGRR